MTDIQASPPGCWERLSVPGEAGRTRLILSPGVLESARRCFILYIIIRCVLRRQTSDIVCCYS